MNEYIIRAEGYMVNCLFDGLAHSYSVRKERYTKPYPEVTGYIIKYFCDYKNELPINVLEAGEKLVELQDKKVGGYSSFYNQHILFVFDTAQIIRGLCALYNRTGKEIFLNTAKKGADFILSAQEKNGALKPIYNRNTDSWVIRDETYSIWNGPFSGLMCKVSESLNDVYSITNDDKYIEAVNQIGDFYEKSEYIEYSHPLGYWLEGLLASGREKKVDEIIESRIVKRVCDNGYISYTDSTDYSYVSGTIQLGIILHKRGYTDEAKKIRDYGRSVQKHHSCGGLFQYANKDGRLNTKIHDEINSWGTKYFCELEHILDSNSDI